MTTLNTEYRTPNAERRMGGLTRSSAVNQKGAGRAHSCARQSVATLLRGSSWTACFRTHGGTMNSTECPLTPALSPFEGERVPAGRVRGMSKDSCPCLSPGVPRFLTLAWAVVILLGFGAPVAQAFPPAPHHLIYGMVRGELGDPINVNNAEVILTTSAGVVITTTLIPDLAPGVNYRLSVPMDSGLTSDPYKPTALQPTVPFRLSVKIGTTTYLPIEMIGDFKNLGQPAGETRLDLTLGEDSDGDGLPDAWERAIIAMLGGGLTLADIGPGDDSDHDGMSNLDEYLAGTYAFDPADGYKLNIVGVNGGRPVLEFTAIRGRTYAVLASTDLQNWAPVAFKIPAEGANAPVRQSYQATDVRVLRVEAEPGAGGQATGFFKLILQ